MGSRNRKGPAAELLPAVAYIRMSSDKQDASPDQQRAEVAKLAEKHGCALIAEYFDEAISGVETTKRKNFIRMISDAANGSFKAIFCWDQDRFGRFDSIDAGEWIAPLRRAGVRLITVAQGEIDWTSFSGRMIYAMQQEGKNQFLVDLSRNLVRGLTATAKTGDAYGKAPYGYDRVFYDEQGKLAHRAKFADGFEKPRSWRAKLVPTDDQQELANLHWIFQTFAKTDCGVRHLAAELNRRGVASRFGRKWRNTTLSQMLTNRTYIGESTFGRQRCGKFHQVSEAGAVETARGKGYRPAPIVVKDAHEPLIDRRLFDLVQRKLQGRKHSRQKTSAPYVLSGILRCGMCGSKMCGRSTIAKGHKYRFYTCCEASSKGTCNGYSVNIEKIEPLILGVVHDLVLSHDNLQRLETEVKRQASARSKAAPATAGLEQQLAKLERQIERGTANLLLADPEDVSAAQSTLRDWRAQRDELQSKLADQQKPAGRDSKGLSTRAMREAFKLRESLKDADPAAVREVLRRVFTNVTLFWEPTGTKRFRLNRGVLEFRDMNASPRR